MRNAGNPAARVLIVEDDPDLHELIVRVVRKAGHRPLSAFTGEQGLSALRDNQDIDWLLTDIRLPGVVDGWVVGSEFTLLHPLRPVIYMSGVDHDRFSRRAANSIFLQKPVNIGDLLGTFASLAADPRFVGPPEPTSVSGPVRKGRS